MNSGKFVFSICALMIFQNSLYAMEDSDLAAEKNKEHLTFENKFRRTRWLDEEEDKELERKAILRKQEGLLENAKEMVKLTKRMLKQEINHQWESLPPHDYQLIKFHKKSKLESILQLGQQEARKRLLEKLRNREAWLEQEKNQQIKEEDLEKLNLQELKQLRQKLSNRLNENCFDITRKYIDRPMVYYEQSEIISNNLVEANQISTKIDFVDETPLQIQIIENSTNEISPGWEIKFTSNGRYFNFTMPFQSVNLMNAVMNKLKNVSAIRIRNTNSRKQPSSAMVLWGGDSDFNDNYTITSEEDSETKPKPDVTAQKEKNTSSSKIRNLEMTLSLPESDSTFNENCTINTLQEDSEIKPLPENNNSNDVTNNIQKTEDKHALEEEEDEQVVIENEQTNSSERSFAQNVIYHMAPYGAGERVLNVMEGEMKRFLEKNDSDMF